MSICATISRVIATPVRAARVVLVGLACAARICACARGPPASGGDAALAYHTRAWAGEPALERSPTAPGVGPASPAVRRPVDTTSTSAASVQRAMYGSSNVHTAVVVVRHVRPTVRPGTSPPWKRSSTVPAARGREGAVRGISTTAGQRAATRVRGHEAAGRASSGCGESQQDV